jgi:hypothetical protein
LRDASASWVLCDIDKGESEMNVYQVKGRAFFTVIYEVEFDYNDVEADSEGEAKQIAKEWAEEDGWTHSIDSNLDETEIQVEKIELLESDSEAVAPRCDATPDLFA